MIFTVWGVGYPYLVKSQLSVENVGQYEFLNRGIGGNRIVDIYARIKADFINLKPDYASLLFGVNDVWHEINSQNGVDTEKFEKIYTMLLDEIFEALPNLKLILLAPYVIEGRSTCNCEEKPDRFERFRTGVDEKIEVVKRIAKKYNLPLIELQPAFDAACLKAPENYWAYDGVHPTVSGHEMIKRLWLEEFEKIK